MEILILSLMLLKYVSANFLNDVSDSKEGFANSQELFEQRMRMHDRKHWNNLVLKRIHKARRRNATCMDGSDARYYLSRQWHSSNWVINLQGGGSCITYLDCRRRSEGPLGSSVPLDDRITGEWTLSNDPKINPTFYNWNKVFIPYCSGDVFVGRMLKKNHPYRLPMLGHYIFKSVIEDLIRLFKINRKGTKILFGGTSAGGVGVLANADFLQDLTYPAEVKAYNDGGWFTLFHSYNEKKDEGLPKFFDTLTTLFEKHWDGFADQTCNEPMPAACLYGELAIKYVKTPMFVMSSMWDLYQLRRMAPRSSANIHLPPTKLDEVKYLESFANNSYRSVSRLLLNPRNGVFSPACYSHVFFTDCIGGVICGFPKKTIYSAGGQSAYGALTDWFLSDGAEGSYIDDIIHSASCNPSCCSKHCQKCKSLNEIINNGSENNLAHKYRKSKKQKDTSIKDNGVEIHSSHNYDNQPIVYYSNSRINHAAFPIVSFLSLIFLLTQKLLICR